MGSLTKKVYICHPYSGDPEGNVEKVEKIVKEISSENMRKVEQSAVVNYSSGSVEFGTYGEYNEVSDIIVTPIAAFLAFPKFMSEDGGVPREVAMSYCISLLSGCDEIWIYDRNITDGMRDEIDFSVENGIKLVWKY